MAHQYKDIRKLRQNIEKMLELLEEWEFIISSESKKEFSDLRSAKELAEDNAKYRTPCLEKGLQSFILTPILQIFSLKH